LATALVFAGTQTSRAEVLIRVDKSAQIMTVTVDGSQRYAWPVSTGISQYDTPNGEFQPFRMERDHFSQEWDDAPMPHSIFFTQQGHAIHGSGHTKNLGHPASHGCVRLSPEHAATLFALVKAEGMKNTHIALVGDISHTDDVVARRGDSQILANEDFTGALPQPRKLRTAPGGWREIPSYRGYSDYDRPYYPARRYYRYGDGGNGGFFPFGR